MSYQESVVDAAKRVDAVGGAGEIFQDRPQRPHIVAAHAAVDDAARSGLADARGEAQDWTDALVMIARAMRRGGRDPAAAQMTDTAALRSIAALLSDVRRTKEDEPEEALRIAIERSEAVAKAIAGAGDEE